MTERTRTLLWALRSPCSLKCKYCYFGTIDEHRIAMPVQSGQLSHLSRTDITAADAIAFAQTLGASAVKRVFLAGGEPLNWRPVFDVISAITQAGIEVVVCTNGIPLNKPSTVTALLDAGVTAVSVSLDSADAAYNDHWRPSGNGKDGHAQVLTGIRALLDARTERASATPRVGIYSVITRANLADVTAVPDLAAELGIDYVVPQPISLATDHDLYDTLALPPEHLGPLARAYADLYDTPPPGIHLPSGGFPQLVLTAAGTPTTPVSGCFGGHTLNFIEPDGSVWDCPSALRIAATAPQAHRSIIGADAADLFGPPAGQPGDCGLFSVDCVNMWPLMNDFDPATVTAARPA